MSINDLQKKAAELKELKNFREELDIEIAAIEDTIKSFMGEREEVIAGAFKIRWTEVKSSRFDSKAFKATHSELYQQYSRETITRRFSVI